MGEVRRRHLRFDDGPRQQPPSPVYVFVEQLHHHVLDVCDVDLIDYSIDGLPEQFPHHLLVGLALRTGLQHLLLQFTQLVRRDVDATRLFDSF